jgi:DNA-binding Lrp family transcriptional regulator
MVEPTDAPAGTAPPGGQGHVAIDATDRRILALLCEDGRMSMRTVAERVGVSRSGAYARVERLRSAGVIVGYGARLDPYRMGLLVTAHVFVTVQQDGWLAALQQFRSIPEVVYCAAMAADHDVFLIVRAASMEAVRGVVLGRLQSLPTVQRTRTSFVLDEETGSHAELVTILGGTPPLHAAAPATAPGRGQLSPARASATRARRSFETPAAAAT